MVAKCILSIIRERVYIFMIKIYKVRCLGVQQLFLDINTLKKLFNLFENNDDLICLFSS